MSKQHKAKKAMATSQRGALPLHSHAARGNEGALNKVGNAHPAADSQYPRAVELSLFDMPALIRQCIDALRAKGIGRVELHHLIIANGKLQLHIKYFCALDRIGECVGNGYDAGMGNYRCFVLTVNESIDIVWLQQQGKPL